VKKFSLTQSEIDNAQKTLSGNSYTIITRKQDSGKYLVSMVDCDTCRPVNDSFAMRIVNSKEMIPSAIKDINRMFDKLAYVSDFGKGMFDASRHR
jgi:hypothetical protein